MANRAKEMPKDWKRILLATAGVGTLAVAPVAGVLTTPRLWAQAPKAQSLEEMEAAGVRMSFDVASVKPNKSNPGSSYTNVPLSRGDAYPPNGGLFSAINFPLNAYILFAFNLTSYEALQLLQLPNLANMGRFDIQARAGGNPTKDQMRLMMQSLLADRFKLAVHTETKQGPVFALVLSKPGKTGSQLQPHADEPCSTAPTSLAPGVVPPGTPSAALPCGIISVLTASAPGRLRIGARDVTMDYIANVVVATSQPRDRVDRPVFDHTGLSGRFDFTVEYVRASQSQAEDAGPSFLQALQEQLGLKLEPTTGPVNVFVVDHVEELSAN